MRPNLIVTVSMVVLVVAVIWGLTTIIVAPNPQDADAAPVSPSIDAMKMMKDARNLPIERFDAY